MEEKNNHQKQENEQLKEHFLSIKEMVEDGQYFKDALDWYIFRYINPMVDRAIMIFVSIIACFSLYFLTQIISSAFPLKEKVPIIVRDYDTSLYRPMISEIYNKEDKTIKNVDEAVAKYLLSIYVNDRESFDFRSFEIEDVNKKFNRIKNISSSVEYKNFQLFMSRDNARSPINYFGENVFQTTEILSLDFIRKNPQNQYDKIKSFFKNQIPNEAEVKFATYFHSFNEDGTKKIAREEYLAKIRFRFAGLDRNAKSGVINFVVDEYKLYKIK